MPIPEEMAPVRTSKAVVRTLVVAVTVLVIGLATAIPAQAGEMHTGLRAAAIKTMGPAVIVTGSYGDTPTN